jgi:hypothetical protein
MDRVVTLAAEDWSLGFGSSFSGLASAVDFNVFFAGFDFGVALETTFGVFDTTCDDVVGAGALGARAFVDERVTRLVDVGIDAESAALRFLGGMTVCACV